MTVAGVSRRHDTVEKVNSAIYRFEDIDGCSDAHKITRLVLRHKRFDRFDHSVHLLRAFSDGKSSDRVTVEVERRDVFHMCLAKILIGAALIYAPKHLFRVDRLSFAFQPVKFRLASDKPAVCPFARFLRITVFGGIFDTFVERHGYCRTEIRLYPHAFFGTHKDTVSVEMAVESHAFFLDLSELSERKDLKTAAVGQNRRIPMNEFVKTSRFRDEFVARSDVQMVSVA